MIDITAMDLNASYPTVLQNITVTSSTTGVLKVQTLTGDLSDNNMLVVQDVMISDCNISDSINIISLTSLTAYDPYIIIFSDIHFTDIVFVQGGNMFDYEHLLGAPVQLVNSSFSNVVGGKINVKSFTTNIEGLTTDLVIVNMTTNNINAMFDSFITLQTGATLTITDSILADIS